MKKRITLLVIVFICAYISLSREHTTIGRSYAAPRAANSHKLMRQSRPAQNKTISLTANESIQTILKMQQDFLDKEETDQSIIEMFKKFLKDDNITNVATLALNLDLSQGINCEKNDYTVCEPIDTKQCIKDVKDNTCVTFFINCQDFKPSTKNLNLAQKIKDLSYKDIDAAAHMLHETNKNSTDFCRQRDLEKKEQIVFCEVADNWHCTIDKGLEIAKEITMDNTILCNAPSYYCIER